MLCYHCLAKEREEAAVAICHRCGAAVCNDHVREWRHPRVPVGLYGPVPAPRELICEFCRDVLADTAPISVRRRSAQVQADSAPLPDTSTAVQYAETFLALQRSTLRKTPPRREHVVQQWLARYLPPLRRFLISTTPRTSELPEGAER